MAIIDNVFRKDLNNKNLQKKEIGKKQAIVSAIVFTIVVVLISGLYLRFEWKKYEKMAIREAGQLVQSLETLLHPEHVAKLSGSLKDLEDPAYIKEKHNLNELVKKTKQISYAYLLKEREGKIIFLIDSEPADSEDYSPPGEVYEEADDAVWEPFRTGKAVVTSPRTDRWGTWINALVPIKDNTNGKVIAVFGIDYAADQWYADLWRQMIPDFMVIFVVLLLYFSSLCIWVQHFRLNRLNNRLILDEALYRSVFEQAPIGIAIMEDKAHTLRKEVGSMSINPRYETILGRKKEELQEMTWVEITHEEDLSLDLEKYERFKKGEISGYTMEKRFIKPDGSIVWTNMKISPLLGLAPGNPMHICLIEDITERKKTESELKESQRKASVLLSHLPGLAYRCKYDECGTMLIVSEGCYNLTGYLPESFINNRDLPFNDIITPEYIKVLWKEWERTIPKGLPYKCEYEIITAKGKRKWVLEMGQGIHNEQGEVEALEGIILDISEKKEFENNLRYLNEHDRLTGLYNHDYLEMILERDGEKEDVIKRAVISVNLNAVQLLTVKYGFHYTQNLIKEAAEVLSQYCSDNRMLFKTYENGFVFYLTDYKDKEQLIEFSQDIAETLELLFVTDRISGGIGILEIDDDNKLDTDLLLRKLMIASEKSLDIFGKDFKTCFYDEKLEAMVNREVEITRELSAIASEENCDQLFLQYQPIYDLRTDTVCGFEALARLRTDKLGLVSPVEFIPIAEKTKLIIPIGEKVLVNAFRFLNRLKDNGFETINISVNVSAIQIMRPDFTDNLFEKIGEMDVNPHNIGLEITESIFTSDYEEVNNIINNLKEIGIHVSIDDFGTGYSSLVREKELEVNCLKIDKYFIDKLLEVGPDKAITSDIISIAHKLGHCVIAEGVEYGNQMQYLRDSGCDKIQGYYISKPLDEDAALELLKDQTSVYNG